MKWDSRANISVGFVLALCSCAAIAFLAYVSTQRLIGANRSVVHTDEVLQGLESTLAEITRSETAERGFVLTGDDRYLQAHEAGVQASYAHLQQLQQLTSDNPQQQARLRTLQRTMDQKVEWQSNITAVAKRSGREAASQLIATRQGQQMTETIRAQLEEMMNEEEQLLRQRSDVARASATSTLRILTAFGVATAFFLSFAFFLIMRDLRAREVVQSQLEIAQDQLRRALDTEKELARVDPLTELANRRAFFEAMESEAARAGRFGQNVTVAYLDVDNLKEVNDKHGHSAGDAALKVVARALRTCLRAVDSSARLGGAEFGVLLPNTDLAAAEAALNKLHQKLSEIAKADGWPVTLSIGAAVFSPPLPTCIHMLTVADGIMYSVKGRGKNSVHVQVAAKSSAASAENAGN